MSLLQNWLDRRDTRIDGWPLMSSPVPVLVLVGAYVYFVKSLGPRLMKDRAALPVGTISRAFNLVQAVANLTLLYKFMVHGWLFRYSFTCQPVNYSTDDAEENMIMETCWWFFITKVAAMFETVFLVLLKRPDLITSFHVVDHALTPTFVWLGVRFVPGGHATFFAALNTFVQYQKNTWWRKHVTGLKALQFAAVFIHSAQLLVGDEQCANVPKEVAYAICGYCALLLTLLCVENETEIKSRFAPLLWITNISEVVKNFMVTLTSACAMDQSALYDSPGQELGHGEDHDHQKEE